MGKGDNHLLTTLYLFFGGLNDFSAAVILGVS